MIATITLNPAVDKTLNASRVVMGTVNRMDSACNMPGGKGINVAKVLRQYDVEVKTLGFIGGYSGDFIEEAMEKIGAVPKFTRVSEDTRTSVNLITEDGYITEFLEPGPNISDAELKEFFASYEKEIEDCDIVVISGSAPRGVDPSAYVRMIEIANAGGKKVLLDTSGDNLKKGMYSRPYMMKPNLKELESIMGRRIQGLSEVAESAMQIVEWGVPHVLVSMGNKGILYARDDNGESKVIYVPAPSIRAVNSVGSGDCAVAAFALSILEGLDPEKTLKKCVAISAANACSLENGLISKEKAEELESMLTLSEPD
ncbi:MAG: 1-phosphofructokinase family hexose kinase [Lachnospiraceae bacterium]|nr:1-phosphofructokinase family hexose kinase [Lachnospiraceae bacterium]